MADLVGQYHTIKKEIKKALDDVLESGRFIMGSQVIALEEALSAYSETRYAIGCNSGTDALQLALMALDIRPGDEVITTPFTFVATAEVIGILGAKPVFVDIDPVTYNIDPQKIEKSITRKTKAIIPVHLYGQPADMDPINEIAGKHGLPVIEDACQSIGARYRGRKVCSLGTMACLSFFPSKNLGAYGDGGMVLTSEQELEQKIRIIANHGQDKRYHHSMLGINSRLDTLQAAILLVRLKHLDDWSEARMDRAALYSVLMADMDVVTPVIAEKNTHVFHQYSIRVKRRDELQLYLQEAGIATAIHYPIPLHLQPAFRHYGRGEGSLPVAESVAKEVLSLPMYPELEEEKIHYIVGKIGDFFGL
ncbi:DegT/DnrJ/EryC1/StrS family aminotransferase [bacterium]|nr:DegT/DnrJ/EryC1/StrS family aminotransferase [bacterium]